MSCNVFPSSNLFVLNRGRHPNSEHRFVETAASELLEDNLRPRFFTHLSLERIFFGEVAAHGSLVAPDRRAQRTPEALLNGETF